jgi:beta-fructofuranosidase
MVKAWGHATSSDLFTWTDHPIAIPDTPSEGFIWSGSIVVDRSNITRSASSNSDAVLAYFTSWKGPEEAQYLAFSLDGGYTFTPYINNPLISLKRHGFRDPKVEWHEPSGRWIMVLTLMDYVVFYASTDLYHWEPLSAYHPYPYIGTIECPQLVRVARRRSSRDGAPSSSSDSVEDHAYLLVLSLTNGGADFRRSDVRYIVGSFDGVYFHPDPVASVEDFAHEFDFGPDVYATAFFHMPYGSSYPHAAYSPGEANLVSVSWASSLVYAGATAPTAREGWRHCMSAVKEHWVDAETNRLVTAPVPFPQEMFAAGGKPEIRHADAQVPRLGQAAPMSTAQNPFSVENPALSWTFRLRAPKGQRAVVQLSFSSSWEETVSVKLGLRGDGTARLSLQRHGMAGWSFPDFMRSFEAENIRSRSSQSGMDEWVVTGVLDRSIVEVYADDGLATGTLSFYADGVLSDISVSSIEFAEGLKYDFEATELRSVWAGPGEKSKEKQDGGRGEMGDL